MARRKSFQGNQKPFAVGAVQTIVFPSAEIDPAGVITLTLTFTGAGNDLTDFDRVRVRAQGDAILDCTIAELQALQQGLFKTTTANALTDTTLVIPLNMPDRPTEDSQDECQFPPQKEMQVEVVTTATIAAGNIMLTWEQTDQVAKYYQKYVSSQINIGTSVKSGKYTFSEGGIIRGFTLPMTGIDRMELVISDTKAIMMPGPQFATGAWGNAISGSQLAHDGSTIATPKLVKVSLNLPAASGGSYLQLDTGTAWVGTSNTCVVLAAIPLAQVKAA